jgi:hypothetical protein
VGETLRQRASLLCDAGTHHQTFHRRSDQMMQVERLGNKTIIVGSRAVPPRIPL